MNNNRFSYKRIPFEYRISLAYLIIGLVWILFSDQFVSGITDDQDTLTLLQHYKGWFYVLATAVSLFFFTKKHLIRIRKAEASAKENEKLKTAFIENMSHELRTPMNAIIGFSELAVTHTEVNSETKQYLNVILKSSKQLLAIVNDVMDTSLLESGNIIVTKKQIDLYPFMQSIYNSFTPLMKEQIHFTLSVKEDDKQISIYTDNEKLRRICNNLINNAIKFTHQGCISFGYSVVDKEIEFFIEDSGVGIQPEIQTIIFERFKQGEIELANRTGGTGLGLSICKEMLSLLDGRIRLQSKPGEGSKFFFTLPLK